MHKLVDLALPQVEVVKPVNTFEAKDVVSPKPYAAKAIGGKLVLQLAPKSITVVMLK